jgi:hypothetical protein
MIKWNYLLKNHSGRARSLTLVWAMGMILLLGQACKTTKKNSHD